MKKVFGLVFVLSLVMGIAIPAGAASYNWTTFDYPGASHTYAQGISGTKIVGYGVFWIDGLSFTYDSKTQGFTVLTSPPGKPDIWEANGIDGDVIVGRTQSYTGFAYNVRTGAWTDIDYSKVSNNIDQTWARGVDGGNVVGGYITDFGWAYGFLYNIYSDAWSTFQYPFYDTTLEDISGQHIVGYYYDDSGWHSHALLYDLSTSTWTPLETVISFPNGTYETLATGIDGSRIAGYYSMEDHNGDYHQLGFVYDMDTGEFESLNYPEADSIWVWGIDGHNVVGAYGDDSGDHGFVASPVPLPSPLILLGSGLLGIMGIRRKKKSKVA